MTVLRLRQVLIILLFLWYCEPMTYALRSGLTKCENLLDYKLFLKQSQKMYSLHFPRTEILENIKKFIPVLTYDQHKGQSGRIGVIGGCEEYTGAPYFAAISALKLGADLSHVFCTKSAAPVIKSYSPELIVHPILDRDDARAEMQKWIPRLHAVVIGPGLGRDASIIKTVEAITEDLKARNKPLVIDADGLFMVTQNINLVMHYKNAIITPNAVEFERLAEALGINTSDNDGLEVTSTMSQALGGLVIARKQKFDIISDGKSAMQITATGSPRRCGGQGDLLSGAAAVFYHWALNHQSNHQMSFNDVGPGVLSAYAACLLSKLCAESAFSKMGRSTTTTDLINEIHHVFVNNFEVARR